MDKKGKNVGRFVCPGVLGTTHMDLEKLGALVKSGRGTKKLLGQ